MRNSMPSDPDDSSDDCLLSDPDDSSDDCLLNVDVEPSLRWQSSAAGASHMKNVYKTAFEMQCEEIYRLRAKLDSLRAVAKKDTAAAKEYVCAAEKLVSRLVEKDLFSCNRDNGDQRTEIEEAQKDLCKMQQSVNTAEVEADEAVKPTPSNALKATSYKRKRDRG